MNKKFLIFFVPVVALFGVAMAGICYALTDAFAGRLVLELILVLGSLPLLFNLIKELFKGHFGVDIIAVTAIVVSFLLGQYLAGAVIVLMMSGGEALEVYALERAGRQLTNLLSRVPTTAHLKRSGGLEDINVNAVKAGDILDIKPGEIIPVDGLVMEGSSEVDESAVTGESLPVEKQAHSHVFSGTLNGEGLLTARAEKPARDSHYEQIVSLVKQAQASRAPIVRLADRYAIWFTVITFAIAILAWLTTRNNVIFLAVLVVATPCPLILATPIAVMSGISKAAGRGIIVKNGGALERLGEAKSFVFDKTGTLTLGRPKVLGMEGSLLPPEEVLRLAASLDQLSAHIFARALVKHARELKLELALPENFEEILGQGVMGMLDGKNYILGKLKFLQAGGVVFSPEILNQHGNFQDRGIIAVYLAEDKNLLGSVKFSDLPRPEIKGVFNSIKLQGINRLVMLTGDKQPVAQTIAAEVGLTEFKAQLLPEQKLEQVKIIQRESGPTAFVGDGINDAPALAAADVGLALGINGATAASDAGDIVVTVNSMERVSEALFIARRVLKIAKQSIFVGIGLSIILMLIAALGYIPPVYGAVIQEIVDVGVILNALRVGMGKL